MLPPDAAPHGRRYALPVSCTLGSGPGPVCGEFLVRSGRRSCRFHAQGYGSSASIKPVRMAKRTSAGTLATPSLAISRLR